MLLAVALLATACGGDSTDPGGGGGGEVAFLGLVVAPDSGTLFVGLYGSVTAQPFDRDHHLVTGVSVSWASSDTNAVQIYPSGEAAVAVFAKAPGQAVITASSGTARATAEFSIRIIPVGAVRIVPDSAAAYAGLTTPLAVMVVDTFGGALTDRPVTWTSSNTSLATVDAAGVVTARAPGAVAIVAASEGKADTASLTVLPRPVADWSAATEDWGTYQGNAGHTGYVPAVLDPGVFAKRWETAVAEGGGFGLNQPAAGGGRVFVSNNAYFGQQVLLALDAATGGERWRQDFGAIHSIDPPAYAGGVVYVATGGHEDSFLRAFDAATGAAVFKSAYENQWSRWQAPVPSGGNVYMAGGYYGGMYGFDGAGTQRWFLELGQYDGFTVAVGDGRVYALTGRVTPQVLVADAATGARVDSLTDPTLENLNYALGGTPVLGAAHDLVTVQGGWVLAFNLQTHGTAWRVNGSFVGQPSVAEGVIYAQNGADVEARRESDGTLLWAWRRPLQSGLRPRMIVTKNILFATDGANTFAVDLAAHLQVWSYPAGGELALSPDGLLLIARDDGVLTAVGVK
jgi:hypothetical protein